MENERGYCGKKCRFNYTAMNEKEAKKGLAQIIRDNVKFECLGLRPVDAVSVPYEYSEHNELIFCIDALLRVPVSEESTLKSILNNVAGFEAVLN